MACWSGRVDRESTTRPETTRSGGATVCAAAGLPASKPRSVNTTPPRHRREGVISCNPAGLDTTLAAQRTAREVLGPPEIALGNIERQRGPDAVGGLVTREREQLAI